MGLDHAPEILVADRLTGLSKTDNTIMNLLPPLSYQDLLWSKCFLVPIGIKIDLLRGVEFDIQILQNSSFG